MNARIAILAAAMIASASAPALAGNPANHRDASANPITELANFTGLSERTVQMIVGCRTCFAEYRYTYDRSLTTFKRAPGEERYQQLTAGLPVELQDEHGVRVVTLDTGRDLSLVP